LIDAFKIDVKEFEENNLAKLTPEDKAEIISHMNADHPDAVLAYVHYFADQREFSEATLVGIHEEYMTIESHWSDSSLALPHVTHLDVAFSKPISNLKEAEKMMVAMFFEAKNALASQD
jgi:hypothetical protein